MAFRIGITTGDVVERDGDLLGDGVNIAARRLVEASSGWTAVAVGAAGRPALGLKAATEQAAVHDALADCVKRDSNCQVIAIGPFSVGPN